MTTCAPLFLRITPPPDAVNIEQCLFRRLNCKMSPLRKLRAAAFSVREVALLSRQPPYSRSFSSYNRPSPKYPHHVPLGFFEKGFLAVGSAVGALLNPRRAGQSEASAEYCMLKD
jgi:ubiquinone biosynthesis protein COQ4